MTLILARTEVLTNHIEMDELRKRDRMVQQQAMTGIEWRASRINIRYGITRSIFVVKMLPN